MWETTLFSLLFLKTTDPGVSAAAGGNQCKRFQKIYVVFSLHYDIIIKKGKKEREKMGLLDYIILAYIFYPFEKYKELLENVKLLLTK